MPFILTLFFFILFANLLGLIPYGSTATGNISVTATLAIITFIVVEIAGMRALGMGYLKTIFYWTSDQPFVMKALMFADHDADRDHREAHEAVRARDPTLREHDGGSHRRARAHRPHLHLRQLLRSRRCRSLMAVAIMMLEVFIAFLQAYVFALLASVFIGLIREGAH